ncbi:hypothetical protein BJ912DRAFT_920650 [Pholiota molesta]|nr:hypothetical protein BJ912DRAFT_920650 [Pholiota molesta]
MCAGAWAIWQKHEAESTSAISLSLAASASVPDGTAWQTDDIFGTRPKMRWPLVSIDIRSTEKFLSMKNMVADMEEVAGRPIFLKSDPISFRKPLESFDYHFHSVRVLPHHSFTDLIHPVRKIERALTNAYKKNLQTEQLLKDLESRLSDDLSNFRAIDSILKDSFSGLQVNFYSAIKKV